MVTAMNLKDQLRVCISQLKNGTLTEQHLAKALGLVVDDGKPKPRCQRLLYLQSRTTLVTTQVEGMSMVDCNGVHDGPEDPDDWPYQTVHEAMLDGWRIIKFPELALMASGEQTTWGLGCEFVLERSD